MDADEGRWEKMGYQNGWSAQSGAPGDRVSWVPVSTVPARDRANPSGAYLGPGHCVGELRVPGRCARQVGRLGASHSHLPHRHRGCQAAGCKREGERQSSVSKATGAGSRVAPGDRAWGPYRSLEAGAGGLATWLERCDTVRAGPLGARRALVPALGTSPRAGPGDSPVGGGG